LKYEAIKCRFGGPVAMQPALPWQPYCLSLVGESSICETPSINLIGLPVSELLQFLIWYVTWRCNLDLWPFDPGILKRDATLVINTGAKFELDKTYRSRVRTTTILGEKGVKFQIASLSNPQKSLPWPERRIMTYCWWGCDQRCNLWAWRWTKTRTKTFMRQTSYLLRPPTLT